MKEIKCTWCLRQVVASQIKTNYHQGEYGAVVERRCPHCGKVLAAYLDEEKGFFSRIRTF